MMYCLLVTRHYEIRRYLGRERMQAIVHLGRAAAAVARARVSGISRISMCVRDTRIGSCDFLPRNFVIKL